MLRSKCDLNTIVRNVEYPPYKSGAPKPPYFDNFTTLRQL